MTVSENGHTEFEGCAAMKKYRLIVICMIFSLAFYGCSAQNPEDIRLADRISIDGLDVSRLTASEARKVLENQLQEMMAGLSFEFYLDQNSVIISGEEIPVVYHIEEALAKAGELSGLVLSTSPLREVGCTISLDLDAALPLLQQRLVKLNIPSKDAQVRYNPKQAGFFSFTSEQSGKAVDVAATAQKLSAALLSRTSASIQVDFKPIHPKVTTQMLEKQYILVSEYTTGYKKSPLNASGRVYNIVKAASMIDGVTVAPGETFDINAILGPRQAETGWKQAPGIRDGKYEMEYGGGVCQVSSTLFNAVMMADLTITERRPHSWPSSYVPIGRDATISTGGPNFCFVNDRDTPVVVSAQTDREAHTLTIRIYGSPLPEGITVKVSSKRTSTIPDPGNKILLDATLPSNTTVVDRKSRSGKKSVTYKEYYNADGQLLERITAYEDTYRAIEGIVYVSSDLYYEYE